MNTFRGTLLSACTLVALTGSSPAWAADLIGLVTKTNTNPFFVTMREAARAKADELGLEFQAFAGRTDGDNDGQVSAIEQLIVLGAKGIMITPSDSAAMIASREVV